MGNFDIKFIPSGRGKAQCPPNPEYPNGVMVIAADPSKPFCTVVLPYPAPECGAFSVLCLSCSMSALVTAAGRPDDPTGVTVNCLNPTGFLGVLVEDEPHS